eukprot:511688_1
MAYQASVDGINEALQKYYLTMGRNDYINDDGDGKFKQYADDNGFEDADIKVELEADPTDCLLVEFDQDFPLANDIQGDDRLKAIHDILKYIAANGAAPSPSNEKKKKPASKLQIDMFISEEQAQKIADNVYKKQLSCLQVGGFPEPDLMYFFEVGYLNGIPLLTWLVDAYTMDKTKHYINNVDSHQRCALNLEDWAQQNAFMKDLMARDKQKGIKLRTAMSAYSNRLLSRLQYVSPTKINDNIAEIVDYVSAIPSFLNHLLGEGKGDSNSGPPFCVDVSFAVREVKQEIANISPVQSQEDDDEDDDDDDDDDVDIGHGIGSGLNTDFIGDLKQKLDSNKRCYASQIVPEDQKNETDLNDNDDPLLGYARFFMNGYRDFRDVLQENGQYDAKSFPRHKRIGIFVDRRRAEKNEKEKRDEVTFFQQLPSCDTIPRDHVDEWYIQAVRECVLPGMDDEKQPQNKRITAQENVNGQLLTFSFNVEEQDAIKCYIIWNGQTMRFKGDNLGKILSYLFVESQQDEDRERTLGEQLAQFDQQVVDMKFEEFYAQIQCGYEQRKIDNK